jgi:hypothetical protein
MKVLIAYQYQLLSEYERTGRMVSPLIRGVSLFE